ITAQIAFPDGSIGVSGLRREIERGNLRVEQIAGKTFTTLANIEDMRKKCAIPTKGRESSSENHGGRENPTDGSSSTAMPADVARKTGASAPSRAGAQELRSDAEKAFADYLGRKHKPEFGSGDPAQVRIADALSFYGSEHAPTVVRADTLADAIENLGEFWTD